MKYIIDTDKLPCNNGKNCTTCPFWSIDDTCEIKEQVKKLPKYEERPHGEWVKGEEVSIAMLGNKTVDIDYKNFTCSECGLVLNRLLYNVDGSPFYKFCPNCGAQMWKEGGE